MTPTLLRIVFGLVAIGWIGYCFYLGFMPGFGSALVVFYTLVLAAIFVHRPHLEMVAPLSARLSRFLAAR